MARDVCGMHRRNALGSIHANFQLHVGKYELSSATIQAPFDRVVKQLIFSF